MEKFEQALERVLLTIVSLAPAPSTTRGISPGTEKPVDSGLVKPVLSELDAFLADQDMQAEESFVALQAVLAGTKWQEALQPLEDCLNRGNYKKAREVLAAITQNFTQNLNNSEDC